MSSLRRQYEVSLTYIAEQEKNGFNGKMLRLIWLQISND